MPANRWVLLILGLYCSCSSGKVITYPHANARFEQYRTYKIAPHQKIAELSAEGYASYQKLDQVIAHGLEEKGYRYHLDADLIVDYSISSSLSQNTRNNNYGRYPWYYNDYYYGTNRNAQQQVEALIEIVAKDTGTRKQAWTGTADLTLRSRKSDNLERIMLKIQEIIAQFPQKTSENP